MDSRPAPGRGGGHAGHGLEAHRRGHLQHQPQLPEGRHRPIRWGMHGELDFRRRAPADQPPLRVWPDPIAQQHGAGHPQGWVLGHVQGRGTHESRTDRDVHRAHRGRHGFGAGGPGHRTGRGKGPARAPCRFGHRGYWTRGRRPGFPVRQPAIPHRHQDLHRRPPRGGTAQRDRQIRRGHRQLGVAPAHWRLLSVPHLQRAGWGAGRTQRGQRALRPGPPPARIHARCGRRRLHHGVRIPGPHRAVYPRRPGGAPD